MKQRTIVNFIKTTDAKLVKVKTVTQYQNVTNFWVIYAFDFAKLTKLSSIPLSQIFALPSYTSSSLTSLTSSYISNLKVSP